MRIAFRDERSVRWTVVPQRSSLAGEPSHTTLIFTSDGGERRSCDGCLPEGGTWEEVDVRAWRALLHHAEVMHASADRG